MFVSGTPEQSVAAFNKPAIEVFAELFFENETDPITVALPVVFKYTEPDRGELYKYPEIVPALSVNTTEPILILKSGDVRKATFKIISHGKGKKTGKIVFKTQG